MLATLGVAEGTSSSSSSSNGPSSPKTISPPVSVPPHSCMRLEACLPITTKSPSGPMCGWQHECMETFCCFLSVAMRHTIVYMQRQRDDNIIFMIMSQRSNKRKPTAFSTVKMTRAMFPLIARYLCGLVAGCLALLGQRSTVVRQTTGAVGTTTARPTTRLLCGVQILFYVGMGVL